MTRETVGDAFDLAILADLPEAVICQLSKRLQKEIRGEVSTAPQQQRRSAGQARQDARTGAPHSRTVRHTVRVEVEVPRGKVAALRSYVRRLNTTTRAQGEG